MAAKAVYNSVSMAVYLDRQALALLIDQGGMIAVPVQLGGVNPPIGAAYVIVDPVCAGVLSEIIADETGAIQSMSAQMRTIAQIAQVLPSPEGVNDAAG